MTMLQEQAVLLNNTVVESMNATANPWDNLTIRSGKKILLSEEIHELRKKKRMIVLFNKPKGYTVAKEDKHNKTIYDLLPESRRKDFYYIGRLDKDSHGLLLLTNDPWLVDYYEKPENNVYKVYEVEIDNPLKTQHIQKAKKWILADGNGIEVPKDGKRRKNENLDSASVELLKAVNMRYQTLKGKHYAIVTLNEWKKRHIRRLFKALGYRIKDLKRVKVWKYLIWTIKPGKYMMQPYK